MTSLSYHGHSPALFPAPRSYILPAYRLDLTAGGRRYFCARVPRAVASISTTPSSAATTIAIMSAQPLALNVWIARFKALDQSPTRFRPPRVGALTGEVTH